MLPQLITNFYNYERAKINNKNIFPLFLQQKIIILYAI